MSHKCSVHPKYRFEKSTMMKEIYFLIVNLIISLFLIEVQCKKNGYPADDDGCKIACFFRKNGCPFACQKLNGSTGSCDIVKKACKCEGLPDNAKLWDQTKQCNKK